MGDPRDRQEQADHQPFDMDLEFAIIGTMLRDNTKVDEAAADLKSEHFRDPLNGRIFDTIVALMGDGDAVTALVVHTMMKADPGIIECGGLSFLEALRAAAPASVSMRTWIKTMQDLALRRQLIRIADQLSAAAVAPPNEYTGRQAADMATEALLLAGRAGAKPVLSLRDLAMQSIKEVEDVRLGKPVPIIPTGFEKVDKEIGGFRGGDLIVIAAKSGMGKSALMGGIALRAALAGYPALFFSLEMTGRQLAERMVCDLDYDSMQRGDRAIWYSKVRNHQIKDEQFDRYVLAAQATEGLPIEVCDEAALSVSQMAARARAFKAKHGGKLCLIVVDYLQKVAPANQNDNRERQVNSIASGLKDLAKMLECPVVAGSQLNEDDKNRSQAEKRPQPSDVRESKGVQHEADLMLSPWRPAYFVEIRKPMGAIPGDPAWLGWSKELRECRHQFELLGLKNRHGRTFDIELFAEMGASAIRDDMPAHARSDSEQAGADLLTNVAP